MPLQIIHQDITKMECDAIVNPTDMWYSGGGGTDLAIHEAAGPALDDACFDLPYLNTGTVAVTEAFALPCKVIIHTVGPIWEDGSFDEEVLLRSCYLNALLKAQLMGLTSIAFPLIASGTFGFPRDKVLRIAIDAVSDFLFATDGSMDVYICVINRDSFELSKEIALGEYLEQGKSFSVEQQSLVMKEPVESDSVALTEEAVEMTGAMPVPKAVPAAAPVSPPSDLAAWIRKQDDNFAVTLLKLIDRKGITDVQCYKKANISRKTYWKINNEKGYKPSKATVIAFAIALELDIEATSQLLKTVGLSLSDSNTFDRIIQFYIMNGIYDVFEINSALYKYDQVMLGC